MGRTQRKMGVCLTCALVFVAVLIVFLFVTLEPAQLAAKQSVENTLPTDANVSANEGVVDAEANVDTDPGTGNAANVNAAPDTSVNQ